MTDYSRQMAFIEKSEDADELRRLVASARRLDAGPVHDAAFRKLITLGIEYGPGSLEHDFWRTVNAFEASLKEERGKTVRLSRTRQKVTRHGVSKTLADWALGSRTAGFEMLLERGMPELLGEAIVLRHADHFASNVVQAAQDRLVSVGIDLDRVMAF